MKKIYSLLFSFSFSIVSLANVGITAPSLTINTCAFPSAYSNLGNIVINEGANGDFAVAAGVTFVLTAPANFQFNPGVGAISQNAAPVNLSALAIAVTATTITITYTSGGTNRDDILTISGIQVRAITGASSGNVTRTGGTGTVAGLVGGTVCASLTSNLSCACSHTVRLTDTFGDGWNGGTIKIQVNGVDVLTGLTFGAGSGPVDFTFNAATGDVINVVETAAGSFSSEMRVEVFDGGMTSIIANHDPGAGTSGNGNCPPPMTFTSATVTQSSVANVVNCASNAQVVCLEIITAGVTTPLSLTQVQTQFAGTAVFGNASLTKVFFTGTSNVFATTTLFGSVASAGGTYNVNGAQNLSTGTNYFWLVYDLNNTGVVGNTVDATIPQFTLSAVNRIPTTTSPAGTRTISICIAPGGVYSGLETWLKANTGVVGATPITGWTNQNTSGTPIVVNGSPNLNSVSTSYNYNPFVDFTAPVGVLPDGEAANRQYLKFSGTSDINGIVFKSLFWTFQLNDLTRINTHIATVENITNSGGPANGTMHGSQDAGAINATLMESAYDPNDFGASSPMGTWQRNGTNLAYNANHSNTKHILSALCNNGGNTEINRLLGGQRDGGAGGFVGHQRDWKGPCSEIIGYATLLTATERQKVNSYLGIKYGVTLSTNYLSTSGGTIFTTAASYNNNIIGIGRDDLEALNQKQSHNDDDLVRIYLGGLAVTNAANGGAFTNDISYVVTGANSGNMCATAVSNAEVPSPALAGCSLYSRLEREWKVTRTNMSQNFNMDFSLAACGAPGSVNVAHLRLLVDDDGNFANGGTQCFFNGDGSGLVFTYSNPIITISNINIVNHIANNASRFITVASINSATPLPIELISYDAKLNYKNTVDLTWKTDIERDNDYFEIEKSFDGITWEFLGKMKGAGNTFDEQNYYLEDKNPVIGTNYYRLIQTDFNGTKNNNGVRIIELKNKLNYDFNYSIYPNPGSNFVTIYQYEKRTFKLIVLNQLGDKIVEMENQNNIDVSSLAEGIYYFSIEDLSGITILKFFKK